jgi:tetratricopeptide (TPR) repeat protein
MSAPLFPPRPDRPDLVWVTADFPFPLALTYARAHAAMDRQQAVEVVWAVRDAVEGYVKFCAVLAAADLLAGDPAAADAAPVVDLLFHYRGLAIGTWVEVLEASLKPLQALARERRLADSPRRLPGLFAAFFREGQPNLTRQPAWRTVWSSFAHWRNEVFGHGVFKHDPAWYAGEALKWLRHLHALYEALRPALAGWRLTARTAGGEEIDWQGCDFQPGLPRHEHVPAGLPESMFLAPPPGGRELPLGPLLTVQRCQDCAEPAAFFFDRQKFNDKHQFTKTVVLEYFRGRHNDPQPWDDVRRLSELRSPAFAWERQVYDRAELEGVPIAFREFEKDYLSPQYLVNAVWQALGERTKGYLMLTGPQGVGKSYLARGLAEKERCPGRDVVVVRYHIRPGAAAEYQAFAIEVNRQMEERFHLRTIDPQLRIAENCTLAEGRAKLQREFADYLAKVMRHKNPDALLLVIDGLDDLPEPTPSEPSVVDLLPPAEMLPDACFVLLTGRDDLRPQVRHALEQLRAAASDETWTAIRLDPADAVSPLAAANQALLHSYLDRELPARLRTAETVAAVLRLSGGVFLYAAHYCRLLERGAFADVGALPPPGRLYAEYLARLEERVGAEAYRAVYRPLLLTLVAAQVPVTLEMLQAWLPWPDRVQAALADLGDFVRIYRRRGFHEGLGDDGEPRYAIAHEAFLRFVEADADMREGLRRQHEVMAGHALRWAERDWEGLDPAEEADLYDLRFVRRHAERAGREDWTQALADSQGYARVCWRIGVQAWAINRHHLGLELFSLSEANYHCLVEAGHTDLENDLAVVLMNKGVALAALNHFSEALSAYDTAIAVFQRLVEAGCTELENDLAAVLMNKGTALWQLTRLNEAVSAFDAAIATFQRLVEAGRTELENNLAATLTNKGIALRQLNRLNEAVSAFDASIAIRKRRVEMGDTDLEGDLATVLLNKGIALSQLNHLSEAISGYETAIAVFQRLVEGGRTELESHLAAALMNKGVALTQLNRLSDAVSALEASIAIRERLVEAGRTEMENDLAAALMNKGVALRQLGSLSEAVSTYDAAIAVFKRLVGAGRMELENNLAHALVNKGVALTRLHRLSEAISAFDAAIAIRERLVEAERTEVENDLATALVNKGVALELTRQMDAAFESYTRGIAIHERHFRVGETYLVAGLIKAYRSRFNLCRQVQQWPVAAVDTLGALDVYSKVSDAGAVTIPAQREIANFIQVLRGLSSEEQEQLFAALGEYADAVRPLFERPIEE